MNNNYINDALVKKYNITVGRVTSDFDEFSDFFTAYHDQMIEVVIDRTIIGDKELYEMSITKLNRFLLNDEYIKCKADNSLWGYVESLTLLTFESRDDMLRYYNDMFIAKMYE